MRWLTFACWLVVAATLSADEPKPKPPQEALKTIQARPGFTVELMAAEPLVLDPVCFAFGPDGRLWVVEMGDYPLGIDGQGGPGGQIRFLEDSNADGKFDKSTVLLDKLSIPTGVMPWRKGVLVTCAPDILYVEDTDGDGKADKKEVLYTGFSLGNQQHRVNTLAWGLDNWIHCANGDSGGQIKSLKTGKVVDIRGRDFRIRPDSGEIDLLLGQTQYGRAKDDWGNWFGNNNSNPMWHYALEDQYLRRNPHIVYPEHRVNVSVTPGASRVYPISKTLERFNNPQSANHFTSACAAMVYRDDLFGPDFINSTFVCEPVHNLVHREVMTQTGTTFTSRRAKDEQESEFLASTDHWFRPCWLETGPDGALWVADMYRLVIEHPEWIPKQVQQKLDLRAGHDLGRIYRVYPSHVKPRLIPQLNKMTTAELIACFNSPNGWTRDMAQQMLIWNGDEKAKPMLEEMAKNAKLPLARLHALCTLDALGIGRLELPFYDKHPGVRRQVLRLLSETADTQQINPGKLQAILDIRTLDRDPQVRLQLAYALGSSWPGVNTGYPLAQLALDDADDRFISAAVMSSVNRKNLPEMVRFVFHKSKAPPPNLIANLLRLAKAFGDQQSLQQLLAAVAAPEQGQYATWQYAALAGFLDALDEQNTSLVKAPLDDDIKRKLAGLFTTARQGLGNAQASKEDRLLAIRLLGRGVDQQQEDIARLAGLLVPQSPDDVQSAIVAALGRLRQAKVAEVLLVGWKTYGPALRSQILDVLLRRPDWIAATLQAIEQKQVAVNEIDATRRQRLLQHQDPAIRQRAAKAVAGSINPDRQKLIDAYQPALAMTGDAQRGLQVFTKNCAGCHKLGDVGHVVGPDLAAVGDKSPQGLLTAVLDPNRVVETRYLNYTAITRNGQTLTGVLAAETGTSITLLGQDGKQQVILRTDLDEFLSTGKSPMPEGVEKEIDPPAMADLIAFIRGAVPGPQRKIFAGNQPELVKPAADGSLLLSAKTCEIYGPNIVFEPKHGNLGYWYSADDRAEWLVEVPRAGTYQVWLDWACVETSAGKPFLLEAGPNQLTAKVASTGSWDTYQQAEVGEIVLAAGPQRLVFRSARRIAAALIDLRSVKLVPVK